MSVNIRKGFLIASLLLIFTGMSWGQDVPKWTSGNDRIADLLTPGLASSGAPLLEDQSPLADSLNPALSAMRQRITLDISYMGLVGNDIAIGDTAVASNYWGHIVSLAASFPSKVGVFTLSGSYLNGQSEKAPFHNQGKINFSFARDVYDDLYFGMGINTGFGKNSYDAASSDLLWSFGVDLGMIHKPGTVGLVDDFVWGVALQNLGWGSYPAVVGDYAAVQDSLFSIEAGFSFTAVEKNDFKMGYMADISLPGFVNMRLKTGFNFNYKDILQFDVATTVDVRELAGVYPYVTASYASLLPSFGFTYRYKPEMKEADDSNTFSELHIRSSAAPVGNSDLWAYGVGLTIPFGVYDRFAPKIEVFPEFQLTEPINDSSDMDESTDDEKPSSDEADTNDQTIEESAVSVISNTLTLIPLVSLDSYNQDFSDLKEASALSLTLTPFAQFAQWDEDDSVEEGAVVLDEDETLGDYSAADSSLIGDENIVEAVEIPENPSIVLYISPNLDGVQDNLIVPFNVTDKRYIKGFNFTVYDNNGMAVKRLSNKEQREENQERSFFKRLFRKKSGIEIPDQFVWNGINENGETAIDGTYHFQIEAWDDNDNIGKSALYSFVLDQTAPEIVISEFRDETLKIFSPNDDGNKDQLVISQKGSVEDQWDFEIISDQLGKVFYNELVLQSPDDFSWDGKNKDGLLVPDGVYHYRISSVDKSGNRSVAEVKNIIISTEQTPIKIVIDKSAISPNEDGENDLLLLTPEIPVKRGILSWQMDVKDVNGKFWWSLKGDDSVPGNIEFDGYSDAGKQLPEGLYQSALTVIYQNGNNPESESPPFLIDRTAPSAVVAADEPIFSPDGDGRKDSIVFRHDCSTEDKWVSLVKNSDGTEIARFEWYGTPDEKYEWDGFLADGSVLEDGKYRYTIEAQDKAGNKIVTSPLVFDVNTIETPIKLVSVESAFSPNNDKVQDLVSLKPILTVETGIDDYSIVVVNAEGTTVRNLKDSADIRKYYQWDGFDDQGLRAAEGFYSAVLNISYKKGNQEKAVSRLFELDTISPQVKTKAVYTLFSPDGDGQKDETSVINTGSEEDKWVSEFFNSEGKVVKSDIWSGQPQNLVWDGSDSNGNALSDGIYQYQISAVDKAGNTAISKIEEIVIDTRPAKLFLTLDNSIISPNGDKKLDQVEFKTMFSLADGLESWQFDLIDTNSIKDDQRIIKSFSGSDRAPILITWDGMGDDGTLFEGTVTPRLEAVYVKGNHLEVETEAIIVDVSAPIADVKINPTPFSPDNDNIDDEVNIALNVSDLSGVEKWLFNIYDPKGRKFKQFKGMGNPVSLLTWDGKSYRGDMVFSAEDYPWKLQMIDRAGNISEQTGKIPVDVLVVRDGDRLKIQIANINFAPNSPRLVSNNPEIEARNKAVLQRLSEILQKYSSYQITIEGHANALRWQNAAEKAKEEVNDLQPLSKARAETVNKILVELGVDSQRLSSKGMGGRFPVVDPNAEYKKWLTEQWQNRRVEFILMK